MSIQRYSVKAVIFVAAMALLFTPFLLVKPASAHGLPESTYCSYLHTDFCDNFIGRTWFKDQTPWAKWYRWQANDPVSAAEYNDILWHKLQLKINENATASSYVNADISTSVIFDSGLPTNFPYGEDTLVEANFKLSPNMSADPYSGANFRGSAGFLLWNYTTFDILGFSVNDPTSYPFAGLWINVVVEGQDMSLPIFDVDITTYHTYGIERLADAANFYIDGELVYSVALNVAGAPTLPATTNLAIDLWVDNASNVLNFETFQVDQIPNDIVDPIYMNIDYFSVTNL